MSRIHIVVILLLLIPTLTIQTAEKGAIAGKVLDRQTGDPLMGANVYIQGASAGSATNATGAFLIGDIPPGEYYIICSYLGYYESRTRVTVSSGDTVSLRFELTSRHLNIPMVEIVGERIEQIQRIPGSALVIGQATLQLINPTNTNEVFRGISGVNVRDEEGQGLRPNIGIRGLDPTRTRKTLMLEDGVPIALAPYGEPELYYNPPVDRMSRIEVLKGSGSILFGPQTVGGVINYITRQPPSSPRFFARITGGTNDYMAGLFSYGGTWQNTGIEGTYLRKKGSGFREHSAFGIHDFTSQFVLGISGSSRLGVKLNIYDENSQSSYLGLTQPMFETNPFQNPANHDEMRIRRYSASATHQQILGNDVLLTTTLYANNTGRNWRRQDFDRANQGRDYERIVGDTTVPGGAIFFRRSTGNRNREFTIVGLEPRVQVLYSLISLKNELDFGARLHLEDMHILRVDGTTPVSLSGTIREDEIRKTSAVSGFVQNKTYISKSITVTTGIRLESFSFTRNFRRGVVDGQLADIDITGDSGSFEVIPGAGLTFKPYETFTFFTGIHRGFSPPRIQDAVDNSGADLELDAERSWNYEVGVRTHPLTWMYGDITYYILDFQNQIIPASEAGGIDTRLINAGETIHKGIEATIGIDAGVLTHAPFNLILEASFTISSASFTSGLFKDNSLPHAPERLNTVHLIFRSPAGIDIQATGFHVSEQFSDRANTRAGSTDGEIGIIPAYTVWDIAASYTLPGLNASLYGTVKNVFDKVYIASRAPRGIFPGPFRQINFGLKWEI
jgi:Fe(3+) dicitrate transport protein